VELLGYFFVLFCSQLYPNGVKPFKLSNGVRSCFLPLLIQMQFILMHYIAGNPSFYKQAKERGNLILILKIRDIYIVIILAIKF